MALKKAPSVTARRMIARQMAKDIKAGNLTMEDIRKDFARLLVEPEWERADAFDSLHQPLEFYKMLNDALTANRGLYVDKDISSTASTAGGGFLRQDTDPAILSFFSGSFGLWDQIPDVPANGPLHRYALATGRGTASFIQELDPVPTDHSKPPIFASTPLAIGATSRGASWLEQMIARQSGTYGGENPLARELADGAAAMGALFGICTYQGTQVAAQVATAYGTTMPYGFQGLQAILENPAGAFNSMYPFRTSNGWSNIVTDHTTGTLRGDINALVQKIKSRPSPRPRNLRIIMPSLAALTLDNEAPNSGEVIKEGSPAAFTLGQNVVALRTVAGVIPVTVEEDDLLGQYNGPAGTAHAGTAVAPIYVVDMSYIRRVFVGSPNPSLFELEFGHDNNLTKRYILALAAGLEVQAPWLMGLLRFPLV